MRVKGFDFEGGAVGLRQQGHAAVRHGAVHVHEEQLDARGALLHRGRDFGNTRQRSLQRNEIERVSSESKPVMPAYFRDLRIQHVQSDVRQLVEVLIIFVRPPLAFAYLLLGFNELYSFNPFDHLIAKLVLNPQPERSAVLFREWRSVHLRSKQAFRFKDILQTLRVVILATIQASTKGEESDRFY